MNLKTFSRISILLEIFENRFFEKINLSELSDFDLSEINMLQDKNVICRDGNYIYINFDKKSNIFLKKLADEMSFEEIDLNIRNEVLLAKRSLLSLNKNRVLSVILIGSVSRNMYNKKSDIDLIVFHSGEELILPKFVNNIKNIQFIPYSTKNFINSSTYDDEILIWGLKYGLIIYDRNYIFRQSIVINRDKSIDSIVLKKREQIEYMCGVFEHMVDDQFSSNELNKILVKIAHLFMRYIVLINRDFPLSKHELKKQVSNYNKNIVDIANMLEGKKLENSKIINNYFNLKKIFRESINKDVIPQDFDL